MKNKEIDTDLKGLVKSSFWIFITLIVSKIILYIYRLAVARELGVEAYGLFSIAILVISLLSIIATLGMDGGVLRFVAYYQAKKDFFKIKGIVTNTLIIGLSLSIIITIFTYFSADYIATQIFNTKILSSLLKVMAFSIPLYFMIAICISYLQGIGKNISANVINNIVYSLFKVIALIIFILIGFKIESISYSYLVASLLVLIVFIYYSKIIKNFDRHSINAFSRKELMIYSLPLLGSAIIFQMQGLVDTTVISHYLNTYEVGLYNSAITIASLITIVPVMLYPIVIQLFTKFHALKDKKNLKLMYQQIPKWIILLNLPFTLLIILFPGAFINILFGKSFLLAENCLVYLSICSFLFSIWMVPYYSLQALKKTKKTLLINILAILINIVMSIILVKKIGMVGAAISTLITGIIITVISICLAYKYIKTTPFNIKLYKGFIAGFLSLLIILIIRKYVVVNAIIAIILVLIFLVVYFVSLIKLKVYDEKDIMIVEAIEKRMGIPIKKYLKYVK